MDRAEVSRGEDASKWACYYTSSSNNLLTIGGSVKRMLFGFVAAIAAGTSFGATVTVSSTGNYGTVQNYTICTTSPASTCANFLTTQNVSGTFTTSGALPASATSVEIGSTVTSYSFTSGLDTVASTDTNARLNSLRVTTDASGNITGINMQAVQWTTGSAPHTTADRFNAVTLSGTSGAGFHNSGCQTTGTGNSGVADTCLVAATPGGDTSRSTGFNSPVSYAATQPPVVSSPASVPTASERGLILMA